MEFMETSSHQVELSYVVAVVNALGRSFSFFSKRHNNDDDAVEKLKAMGA